MNLRRHKAGYIHKAPWYARRFGRNVHPAERWVSVLGALGLMVLGRRRARNRRAAAVGSTFLMRRGLTGVCPVYRRLGLSTT